jgi:hypothetical protein
MHGQAKTPKNWAESEQTTFLTSLATFHIWMSVVISGSQLASSLTWQLTSRYGKCQKSANTCTSKTNTYSSKIDSELWMLYTLWQHMHTHQSGKESSTQAQSKHSRMEQKVNPPHSLPVLATFLYQMSHVALCCDKSNIQIWKVTKKQNDCELH